MAPWCLAGLFLFALVLATSLVGLELALWPLHRARRAHWSERAQALLGARYFLATLGLSFPILAAVFLSAESGRVGLDPDRCAVVGFLAASLGLSPAIYRLHRACLGRFSLRRYLATLLYTGLFSRFTVVITLVALPLVRAFDLPGLAVLAAAAGLSLVAPRVGFTLLSRFGVLRPAGPHLARINDEVAAQLDRPAPHVLEVGVITPNAFALLGAGPPGLVLVTDAALAVLDDDELAAVLAHEHGHVHDRIGRGARLLAALRLWPLATLLACGWPFLLAPVALSAILIARTRRIIRRSERHADGVGRDLDAAAFARGLEKLYQAALLPAVGPSPGVHGHLYDRMRAAGVEPGFPRPKPRPPIWSFCLLVAATLTTTLAYLDLCVRYLPALPI